MQKYIHSFPGSERRKVAQILFLLLKKILLPRHLFSHQPQPRGSFDANATTIDLIKKKLPV